VDVAPEKESQSGLSFILADLPNIPRRMPVQCSSVYQSLLWCCCDVQASTLTSSPSICG